MKSKKERKGYFGAFGGQYVPETLMSPLQELERAYLKLSADKNFRKELSGWLINFVGRPTPLYFARQLTNKIGGARIFLKREDLTHTGAHKINNALGQALLAKSMGKKRLIAETGAGQHGVATATVAAALGMKCVIYMGDVDMERQQPNVQRMKLLGARVIPVSAGSKTLKDAINEAIRDWVTNINSSHYLIGSVLGPHPYPTIVRDFQKIIGKEAKEQIQEQTNRLPDYLVACVGGGSNSIGLFYDFLNDKQVKMVGVEAGGISIKSKKHAARFAGGSPGILHGTFSYVLQDKYGQITETHSISAGLDYPSIGPEHAHLQQTNRVEYTHVTDKEALKAFMLLAETEGIIPALESAHAMAYTIKLAKKLPKDKIILVNLSGRGDKDLAQAIQHIQKKIYGTMNAFQPAFKKVKGIGKPAFMPFLVAGDPNYKGSLALFRAIAPYSDMLEIGFPYSDPLADGPTIQAADERALHSGIDTDKVFSLIHEIRSFYKGPISVLVYANLVYQYGITPFYKQAAIAGINGVLVPDVPYEEAAPFVLAARKYKISPIFMVTQTTNGERLKKILQYAEGYLYLVSVLGVTGSRNSLGKDTFDFIRRIKKATLLPLALGFGISSKEHIKNAAKAGIDGVIVGSAIIKILEANLTNHAKAAKAMKRFIEDTTDN